MIKSESDLYADVLRSALILLETDGMSVSLNYLVQSLSKPPEGPEQQ